MPLRTILGEILRRKLLWCRQKRQCDCERSHSREPVNYYFEDFFPLGAKNGVWPEIPFFHGFFLRCQGVRWPPFVDFGSKNLQNSIWRLPLELLFFVTNKKTLCLAIESESTSFRCCAHWVENLSFILWKMTCCTLCSTDFHQAARDPDKHSPHQNQGRWWCVAYCCAAFISSWMVKYVLQ